MLTKDDCKGYYLKLHDTQIYKKERRDWTNSKFHFDNVPQALLTLFTVATFEGWPSLLHTAIDSNGEGLGPVYNHRPFVAPFFIAFIIVNKISLFQIDKPFSLLKGHWIFYDKYIRRFCHCYISK
jgi:voltage-dependent calcium channel L type alpha-1D